MKKICFSLFIICGICFSQQSGNFLQNAEKKCRKGEGSGLDCNLVIESYERGVPAYGIRKNPRKAIEIAEILCNSKHHSASIFCQMEDELREKYNIW